MFKIIESNQEPQNNLEQSSENKIILELVDDKYNVDQINEYISFFHKKNENNMYGIILHGELLTEIQQNKLLKTFEEAKLNHNHLMYTKDINKIIDTVKSRAIIEREDNNFVFESKNKLEKMYEDVIKEKDDLEYFNIENELFQSLYNVLDAINRQDYNKALIARLKITFTYRLTVIFINWIENKLYKEKDIIMLKKIFEFEKQLMYNVNLDLLVDAIMIELKRNKKFYIKEEW